MKSKVGWKSNILKNEALKQRTIDHVYSLPNVKINSVNEKNIKKLKSYSTLSQFGKSQHSTQDKEDEHYYSIYIQDTKEEQETTMQDEELKSKKVKDVNDPLFKKKYGHLNQYSGINFIEKINEGYCNIVINVEKLIQRMCPIFYFHKRERYMPMDVDDYIEQCILKHRKNDMYENKKFTTIKDYPLTFNDLKQNYKIIVDVMKDKVEYIMDVSSFIIQEKNPMLDNDFYITPKYRETLRGATFDEMTPYYNSKVPIYCHVVELEKEYRLLYSIFFPYYTGYRRFRKRVGSYEGCWSYVAFYFHKESLTMTRAYYRSYNDRTSHWVAPIDIQYEKGRPIVYVSKGTHYCYPYPKTYYRNSLFKLLRYEGDRCSKGVRWFPHVKLFVTNKNQEKDEVHYRKNINPIIEQQDVILYKNEVIEKNYKVNPIPGLDISGVDISGLDISGVDISGLDISGVDISGLDISGVDISGVDISGSNNSNSNQDKLHTQWLYFKGKFGKNGQVSPLYQEWFHYDNIERGKYISDIRYYQS